jgi:hypothetical protein
MSSRPGSATPSKTLSEGKKIYSIFKQMKSKRQIVQTLSSQYHSGSPLCIWVDARKRNAENAEQTRDPLNKLGEERHQDYREENKHFGLVVQELPPRLH